VNLDQLDQVLVFHMFRKRIFGGLMEWSFVSLVSFLLSISSLSMYCSEHETLILASALTLDSQWRECCCLCACSPESENFSQINFHCQFICILCRVKCTPIALLVVRSGMDLVWTSCWILVLDVMEHCKSSAVCIVLWMLFLRMIINTVCLVGEMLLWNREQVARLMHGTPEGAFLVRDASDRVKDSYTLTLR